jgi:hypothetical protein
MQDPAPTQAGGLLRLLFLRLGSLPTDTDQCVQRLQVLLRRAGPSTSAAHSPKPPVDPASVFSVVICESCRKRGRCEPALRLDPNRRRNILNEFGPQSEILVTIGRLFTTRAPESYGAASDEGLSGSCPKHPSASISTPSSLLTAATHGHQSGRQSLLVLFCTFIPM